MATDSSLFEKTSSSNFRALVRQASIDLSNATETVVLPPNRRSLRTRAQRNGNPSQIDLERSDSTESESLDPNQRSFPFLITLIAIIQILLFFIMLKNWDWLKLCYDPFRRHEVWRFFSVSLVHGSNYIHLITNVIFELLFGLPLEAVHGWKRVGLIFFSGVAGGTLATTLLVPYYYTMGASGGVYGLLAAHVVTILLNWAQMDRKALRIGCLSTYILLDVVIAHVFPVHTVTHLGNIGGAIGGFVASVFILRNFEVLSWEKTFQKIVGVTGILLFLATVIVNVGFPSQYFESEFNFDYVDTYFKYVFTIVKTYSDALGKLCEQDPRCLANFTEIIASPFQEMKQ